MTTKHRLMFDLINGRKVASKWDPQVSLDVLKEIATKYTASENINVTTDDGEIYLNVRNVVSVAIQTVVVS